MLLDDVLMDSLHTMDWSSDSELSYHASRSVTPDVLKIKLEDIDLDSSFSEAPSSPLDSSGAFSSEESGMTSVSEHCMMNANRCLDFIAVDFTVPRKRKSTDKNTINVRNSLYELTIDNSAGDPSPSKRMKTLAFAASVAFSNTSGSGSGLQASDHNDESAPVSPKETVAAEALLKLGGLKHSNLSPSISPAAKSKDTIIDLHSASDLWKLKVQGKLWRKKAPQAFITPNPGWEKIHSDIREEAIFFNVESGKFEAPRACKG